MADQLPGATTQTPALSPRRPLRNELLLRDDVAMIDNITNIDAKSAPDLNYRGTPRFAVPHQDAVMAFHISNTNPGDLLDPSPHGQVQQPHQYDGRSNVPQPPALHTNSLIC